MQLHSRERGFTLIELLVVIAIIGLLASIVLASLESAREKSRNARRVTDLKQYQLALELYYDENGGYPASAGWDCLGDHDDDACWAGGVGENAALHTALSPFISGFPVIEHLAGLREGYIYEQEPDDQGYRIHYTLEGINQNCAVGGLQSDSYNGGTLCRVCAGSYLGDSWCP